jgi:hypothetical protein
VKLADLPPHVRDLIAKQDAAEAKGKHAAAVGKLAVVASTDPLAKLNKTETAYASLLETRKRLREIRDYRIQSITLLLGPNVRYTPDFNVVANDGVIEMHETKGGYAREDAIVKFKIARGAYPWFRFIMLEGHRGQFKEIRGDARSLSPSLAATVEGGGR